MADTWYSYECALGCSRRFGATGLSGVVLDLRLPWAPTGSEAHEVRCPVCTNLMGFRGSWPATESGHGSRGDHDELARDAVDKWIDGLLSKWETALKSTPPDMDALSDMPPLPGRVSIGGFMEELRVRRLVPVPDALRGYLTDAEHLSWCEYRNGHYDESRRCDCGLVALRKQARQSGTRSG